MKKTVGLLFSLVLLASIVNAWGPLTHNAIAKKAGGNTYGAGLSPDIYYTPLFRKDAVAAVMHKDVFGRQLYTDAEKSGSSTKKNFAKGWITHIAADPIMHYSKRGYYLYDHGGTSQETRIEYNIDVLSLWEQGGSSSASMDKSLVKGAYDKVRGSAPAVTESDIYNTYLAFQTGAAALEAGIRKLGLPTYLAAKAANGDYVSYFNTAGSYAKNAVANPKTFTALPNS